MKKIFTAVISILLISLSLSAQNNKPVTVKAGTLVIDYFPYKERYMFTDFNEGKVVFRNGRTLTNRLNYNFLLNEMQFIQSNDTLSISNSNKKDIRYISIKQDTFYIRDQYLHQIRAGRIRIFENQDIHLKDILKKGAMGTVNRSSASDSYNTMSLRGKIYDLRPEEDWVFQKTPVYFISVDRGDFVPLFRKSAIQLIPGKEDTLKDFIRTNKINFESRDDIVKLADFISGLIQ